MGHPGESFHAILGAAAALRGLLLAGMGAGLLTPSCVEPEREFVCAEAQSQPGGFVRCKSGTLHRPDVAACTAPAAPFPVSAHEMSGVRSRDCSAGADCTLLLGVFCQQFTDPCGGGFVHCVYPCLTDDDCGQGFACFCGSRGGECVPAECTSQADCADAACVTLYTVFECHPTLPRLACWTKELQCDSARCENGYSCIEG